MNFQYYQSLRLLFLGMQPLPYTELSPQQINKKNYLRKGYEHFYRLSKYFLKQLNHSEEW